jgi:hypothetical protein
MELAIKRDIVVGPHPVIYTDALYNVNGRSFGLRPNAYPSPYLKAGGSRRVR